MVLEGGGGRILLVHLYVLACYVKHAYIYAFKLACMHYAYEHAS
jgi:hypothetical protein